MNRRLRSEHGQFIPISAMVMFTIVVFMVAVLNVYKVSRAKLEVQNLADATALHLSAQQATILNHVNDRNEWLNHMYSGPFANKYIDPTGQAPPSLPTRQMPNINEAAKPSSGHYFVFNSSPDAVAYARLLRTVNDAQK